MMGKDWTISRMMDTVSSHLRMTRLQHTTHFSREVLGPMHLYWMIKYASHEKNMRLGRARWDVLSSQIIGEKLSQGFVSPILDFDTRRRLSKNHWKNNCFVFSIKNFTGCPSYDQRRTWPFVFTGQEIQGTHFLKSSKKKLNPGLGHPFSRKASPTLLTPTQATSRLDHPAATADPLTYSQSYVRKMRLVYASFASSSTCSTHVRLLSQHFRVHYEIAVTDKLCSISKPSQRQEQT